jgi:hypothetical protein
MKSGNLPKETPVMGGLVVWAHTTSRKHLNFGNCSSIESMPEEYYKTD